MDDDTTIDSTTAAQVIARGAKDDRGHAWFKLMAALALLGTLLLAGGVLWMAVDANNLRSTVASVSNQQAQAATIAQQLASQLRGMGAVPVASPPAPVSGQQGPAGASGPSGRGISSTVITGGHLVVGYTDGTTADEGQVVGKDGTGITSSVVNGAGHLILSYSNGAVDDVGAVVGPAGADGSTGAAGATGAAGTAGSNGQDGCGIASVGESDGNLVVNYTGATCATPSATVGPLPAGPQGPAGATGATGGTGPPPYSWSWTDELGTKYMCTENPDDPAGTSTPTYVCNPQ